MNSENYYKLLCISENARDVEIRKSYIKMIRQFSSETHPEEFQLLTKAYKILSNEQLRAHYDAQLKEKRLATRILAETENNHSNIVLSRFENEDSTINPSEALNNRILKNKKKKSILQTLLACGLIYLLYFTYSPVKEISEPAINEDGKVGTSEKIGLSSSTEDTNVTNEKSPLDKKEETTETETIKNTLPSKDTMELLLRQYFLATVEVNNGANFSKVEPFLDPQGKKLEEQRIYTTYLRENGITEKFVSINVKGVKDNNGFVIATVEETYDIFYSDESIKRKVFESQYRIKRKEEQFLVNELLFTNELSSEDLREPELIAEQDSVEQFLNNYLVDSVNAVNQQNFSYVESYLSPNSDRYIEQSDYTSYLIEKGITEELLSFSLIQLQEIGNQTYEATTKESYTIYYADGSSSYKEFESKFHITQNDSLFKVAKLIYTKEV